MDKLFKEMAEDTLYYHLW